MSILSPLDIRTSMTSTSSKSPRSGTTSVCLPADFGASPAGVAMTVVSPVGAAAIAGAMTTVSLTSTVILPMTDPVDTVSPTATEISSIVPPSGAGTSIAALSVSSVIRPSSLATLSPAVTRISITSTSEKSPRSGTTMSILFATRLSRPTGLPDPDGPGRSRISRSLLQPFSGQARRRRPAP